jgi:SAM-dependent methyltransferase
MGWEWNKIDDERWNLPSEESYYLLNRWKSQGKLRFLDLGCGKGRHSLFFAKNGFEVYALDISESGISILEDIVKRENLKINTYICDMHSLPFPSSYFDCILAYHVIYHTNRRGLEKIISEIKRVLKDDGEIFVTFNSKQSKSFNNPKNVILEDGTIIKKEGIEAGILHYYLDKEEVLYFMRDFDILSMKYIEEIIPKRSNKYFILARKK